MANDTKDLWVKVQNSDDLDGYLKEHDESFIYQALPKCIERFTAEKNVTIARVAKLSGVSESYMYKLSEGHREKADRNKLIRICFGFGLTPDEANTLLRAGGTGILYPRIRRDSIIIYCLNKSFSIKECNEYLIKADESTLE